MKPHVRLGAAGLALCAGLGVLSACTSNTASLDGTVPIGSYRLVAFDSCEEALTGLRTAAKSIVGPYGFTDFAMPMPAGGTVPYSSALEGKAGAPAASDATAQSYSGTNTHEVGVDEPDLVKTDGRRIVTVTGNRLTVVNAANQTVTGSLDLSGSDGDGAAYPTIPGDLLLSGDQALVLMRYPYAKGGVAFDRAAPPSANEPNAEPGIAGPRLVLVSLTGQPRVLSSVTADGTLIDARQVGSTVRVVLRSSPRFSFPYPKNLTDAQRVKTNQSIIDQAPLDRWLPRIETTTGGSTQRVRIDCSAVSRPAVYTGANLVTVLSFNLAASSLGDGQPTTLVADGDTVYSNGPSLYVASNRRVNAMAVPEETTRTPAPIHTEIYKFDTSTPRRPTFAAGGSVPGYLVNQYAMSEWNGNLRVAATTPVGQGQAATTKSGVYVLAQDGRALKLIGSVEGLGKGERIYSVRFVGPTGYVVTFRQTDPLYTVDLRDPTKPTLRGELKIPGYSAYLHPASDSQLIGIGQNATNQGRVTGTQISLFDISNLADPTRLAQYSLSGAHSEAEFDPHAFLFWPATGLLVVPLQTMSSPGPKPGGLATVAPEVGALVLRVVGQAIREVGFIQQPASSVNPEVGPQIRRSLVIDQTLWTVSDRGLMASDLNSLALVAWIPLG
jgi:Beta propeller domain